MNVTLNVNNKDKCDKKKTVHGLILSCSVPLLNACEKSIFRLTTNIEQLAASDIMHSDKIMLLCSSTVFNSPTLYLCCCIMCDTERVGDPGGLGGYEHRSKHSLARLHCSISAFIPPVYASPLTSQHIF